MAYHPVNANEREQIGIRNNETGEFLVVSFSHGSWFVTAGPKDTIRVEHGGVIIDTPYRKEN